ncbi:MAG: hypothetical protein QOF79_227 [Actinomycetota bacterium]|nr:hypothetical protein [Actinomycetota bacterium]
MAPYDRGVGTGALKLIVRGASPPVLRSYLLRGVTLAAGISGAGFAHWSEPSSKSQNGKMDAKSDIDPADGRNETEAERSDRNWTDILQELRVTQTGTQIISGFLLTVAFQQRFTSLPPYELVIYGALVALAAVSTLLGLSAVSLHRAQFRRHGKPQVVNVASRLLAITVWVVAILAVGVVLFIFDFVFNLAAGLIAGVIALAAILLFIVLIPRSPGHARVESKF